MWTKILELYDSHCSFSGLKGNLLKSVNLAQWKVNHISASDGHRKLKHSLNYRNVYVYSTEYNIKLQDLYFLRYLQKTDFGPFSVIEIEKIFFQNP